MEEIDDVYNSRSVSVVEPLDSPMIVGLFDDPIRKEGFHNADRKTG